MYVNNKTLLAAGVLLAAMMLFYAAYWVSVTGVEVSASDRDVAQEIWWPEPNAKISGIQPFKARVQDTLVTDYYMFWQVDNGQWNHMYDSYNDNPHKEALVDLSGWNWKGGGPYTLSFIVQKHSGEVVGKKDVVIYVDNGLPISEIIPKAETLLVLGTENTASSDRSEAVSISPNSRAPLTNLISILPFEHRFRFTPPVTVTPPSQNPDESPIPQNPPVDETGDPTPLPPSQTPPQNPPVETPPPTNNPPIQNPPVESSGSLLKGAKLYVNPDSEAKRQADAWRQSRPNEARQMDKIAANPESMWIGNWNNNISKEVSDYTTKVTSVGAIPVFVAYNVMRRDCGGYSSGGAHSIDEYKGWIQSVANAIGERKAAVVLEPDAIALWDCLGDDKQARKDAIRGAITILKSKPQIAVYVDAGHANWVNADDMAARLKSVGIENADGFALNVSNFQTDTDNVKYGEALSAKIGGKHFVVDSSRSGRGSNGEWCNPSGRALGTRPTTNTGNNLVDAYIWIKKPGESDGNCNGGPSAGAWWAEYALGLAERAAY